MTPGMQTRPWRWGWSEILFFPLCYGIVVGWFCWRLLTAVVDGWEDVRHGRLPPLWRDLIEHEREVWRVGEPQA